MVKRRILILVALVSVILSAVTPMLVLAANAVLSVGLNSGSCSAASALIDITLDSAAVRESGQAALSDGTVLRSFEHASGAGTSYSGTYGFGSWTAVPNGTIISLYGYIGQTPPSASDSVEFFVAYRCDTGAVVATCGGPAGSCPHIYNYAPPSSVCLNTLDGRLNNSGAFDCAAPIVLFNNDGRLDVYGVGGGESTLLFSIQDADISGGTQVLDNTSIPSTGKPVRATRQGDGSLLLEAFYEDGKPYTIIYTPSGSPQITHVAW